MVWITIDVSPNDNRLDLSESTVRAYSERDDRGHMRRLYEIDDVVVMWDGMEVIEYDENAIHDLLIEKEREAEEWRI